MVKKNTFSMISLGCARALMDSESMINRLQGSGFSLIDTGTGEHSVILNTCSFIQAAIDETEAKIKELQEEKKAKKFKYLLVVGCYPSRFKEPELLQKFPDVDAWLPTAQESKINETLSKLVFKTRYTPKSPSPYIKLTPSHYSYLKISEGCNNWCSFCTIPKIRGTHTSKPLDTILKDAQQQIDFGCQELLLIAEDTTAWGEDLYGKPNFPKLLDELCKLDVRWVRPMYIFPSRVTDELIDVIAKNKDKIPYIDIPIQHTSTTILDRMQRKHDHAFLKKVISDIKRANPNISLRTTLLLGFPGETDDDIKELLDFMTELPFNHIGCFGYSPEKNTRAIRFEDTIPDDIIQKRIHTVMEHQYSIAKSLQEKRIGSTTDIVIESESFGRSSHEAPDVDSIIQFATPTQLKPGTIAKGKILQVDQYDLIAELEQ